MSILAASAAILVSAPVSAQLKQPQDPRSLNIVQNLGGAYRANLDPDLQTALDYLEAQAEADLIDFHKLGDDGLQQYRMLDYARGELRSKIYARLVDIAMADTRTDEEQTLAEAFAEEWHQYHLHTLQLAKDEYLKWKADPCGYVPPDGFSYDPDPNGTLCSNGASLSELFNTVQPPSLDDFLAYGQVLAGLALQDSDAALATGMASRGLQLIASVGVGSAVSAAAGGVLIATADLIFPFAAAGLMFPGAAGPTLAAALAAIGAVPIIGTILIILLAVVVAVIQGINVFDAAAIGDNLDQAIQNAQTRPALFEVLSTDQGRQEFFNAFMLTTLPDYASDADAPPPAVTDDWFVVADANGANPVTEDSMTFFGWPLNDYDPPMQWTLRMTHGWFVPETDTDVPNQGTQHISGLSLAIEYMGWDWDQPGVSISSQLQERTAWRVGRSFFILPKGGDPKTDGHYSDTIRFLEPSGDSFNYRLAHMDGDDSPPVIKSKLTGTLGNNDWYISPVNLEWTVSDPDSDIVSESCNSKEYSSDSIWLVACAATSSGGTTNATVSFKIDVHPPTISGSGSPAPNAAGWNNSDVNVHFSCTDPIGGSGVATDGCGPDTVVSNETPSYAINVTGTATDNAGNKGYGSAGPFWIDKTPPTITGLLNPQPNANGWYQAGPVAVSFECADSVSGIKSCTDTATTISGEGADHPVTGTAVDIADNSATKTVNVNIDGAPPTISASAAPSPNAFGWNNSDVTVSFICDDLLSGVDSCTAPVTLNREGGGQTVDGTAADKAGNKSTTTSAAVNIDKTPPTITGLATPVANSSGWNNSAVEVAFQCEDTLSGVQSCPETDLLGSEGVGQSTSGTAYDNANNSHSTSVDNINIDLTLPTITAAAVPAPNTHGWNNSDVTVSFGCSDALSGVDNCTPPVTLSGEGAGQTVPGSVTDKADNANSTTSAAIDIDKTAPTIAGSISPEPNGAGWNNTAVTVTFDCSDALSGIQWCSPPAGLGGEGTGQSAAGSATDNADNGNSTTVSGINIDRTKPVITIVSPPATSPEYLLNEVVTADWSASDVLSGLASATGSSPSGEPVDTATPGLQTFSVEAHDNAGNVALDSREYTVLSPTDAIQDIEDSIQSLVDARILKPKQSKGLLSPLANAIRSYGKGKVNATCNQLADFVSNVQDMTPSPLDTKTAKQLIGAATDIATISLDCSW